MYAVQIIRSGGYLEAEDYRYASNVQAQVAACVLRNTESARSDYVGVRVLDEAALTIILRPEEE